MLALALERPIEYFHGFSFRETQLLSFARTASREAATEYLHETNHCLRNFPALEHRHKEPIKLFLSGNHFEPILRTTRSIIPSNIDLALNSADTDWSLVYEHAPVLDAGILDDDE